MECEMSVSIGDIVKVSTEAIITALLEGKRYDVEGLVVDVYEDEDDPELDYYNVQLKLPPVAFFNNEINQASRRLKS
jgi:hypothetical protein